MKFKAGDKVRIKYFKDCKERQGISKAEESYWGDAEW